GRALSDPATAVLATTEVQSDGTFSFQNVDISDASVGIVLTTAGGSDIVTSSLGLCQIGASVHPVLRCEDKSNVQAFVVPTSVADTLATTTGNADLVTNGFVLGMVLDNGNNPIRDVEIKVNTGEVVTLDPTLTPTGNAITTDIGAFLVTGGAGVVNIAPEQ